MTSHRNRWAVACLCTAIVGTSTFFAVADDKMMPKDGTAKDVPMMNDKMVADQMAMLKDGMKDDASKMAMTADLARMTTMEKMAMAMCSDEKCMKTMHDDPAMMKMMDDAAKMAADPAKMGMMHDDMMKDPAAMKQVMMMSMAHAEMMKDVPMDKGTGHDMSKMDGGMPGGMQGDKMPADKMK